MPGTKQAHYRLDQLLRFLKEQGFRIQDKGVSFFIRGKQGTASFHRSMIDTGDSVGYANVMASLRRIGFTHPEEWERAEAARRRRGLALHHRKAEEAIAEAERSMAMEDTGVTVAGSTQEVYPSADEIHQCPECGKAFNRPTSLGAHRWKVHGVVGAHRRAKAEAVVFEGAYKCSTCGREFPNRYGYAAHIGQAHKAEAKATKAGKPSAGPVRVRMVDDDLQKLLESYQHYTASLTDLITGLIAQLRDERKRLSVAEDKLGTLQQLLGKAVDTL